MEQLDFQLHREKAKVFIKSFSFLEGIQMLYFPLVISEDVRYQLLMLMRLN